MTVLGACGNQTHNARSKDGWEIFWKIQRSSDLIRFFEANARDVRTELIGIVLNHGDGLRPVYFENSGGEGRLMP